MYSFDFKVLLGFCRYFLLFFSKKKERQEKVVYQLKWCVIISLTVCSFTSKESKKLKINNNVKDMNV